MKEVVGYVWRKFSYREDIQHSIENNIKTGFPSSTRPTVTGDCGELYRDQKFMWERTMTLYVKQETNQQELSESLRAHLHTVYQAHALKTRG